MNPTPGNGEKFLCSALDFEANEATPEAALSVCEWYRVSEKEARAAARDMARVLAGWRKAASKNGISKQSQERMASCFEAGVGRLRNV